MAKNRLKRDRLYLYKFSVDWQILDQVGNILENSVKQFETKKEAEAFIQELKRNTQPELLITAVIRDLQSGEIIQKFSKKSHERNYSRAIRKPRKKKK